MSVQSSGARGVLCRRGLLLMVSVLLAGGTLVAADPSPGTKRWQPPAPEQPVSPETARNLQLLLASYEDLPPSPARIASVPGTEGDVPSPTDDEKAGGHEPAGMGKKANGLDEGLVARGQSSFSAYCLDCHDADRSLQKRKSFGGWLSTVQAMAKKEGAEIPAEEHRPIASYLAKVAGTGGEAGAEGEGSGAGPFDDIRLNATFAPLWRGTGGEGLDNAGFFADVWIGADWKPQGPVSATVMTCTSCHNNTGFTVEFVEASATLDLKQAWKMCRGDTCPDQSNWNLSLKGGRFIVPFGAFAGMSHPAALRTVANPLLFDMGRRFNPLTTLPVLPGPYSDEGFDLNYNVAFAETWNATVDAYAVNGLQGGVGMSMTTARAYNDNNKEPFLGGRATVGNKFLRLGSSYMSGVIQNDGSTVLTAELYGVDATWRYEDLVRLYFEYALRANGQSLPGVGDSVTYGTVYEAEVRICDKPRLSLLARYDNLVQKSYLLFGDDDIDRYTWGVNYTLPGGSLLMLNHEHWVFSYRDDEDVIAAKWVVSF